MNMMSLQDEREEQAVPAHSAQLENDLMASLKGDLDPPETAAGLSEDTASDSLFERAAWFRNLSIRGKVHAIFGTFFALGFAIVMVLGLGLGELWLRYQASAQVQEAVLASTELRAITGELRYNSARFIFERENSIAERQRASSAAAEGKLDAIEGIIAEHLPVMNDRLARTRADFAGYSAAFNAVVELQGSEGRTERSTQLAYELAGRGDALLASTDEFAADLDRYSDEIRDSGIAYFFTMVIVVSVIAVLAAMVLLMGLGYLSRDFSRKISEVTEGMTRLASGDRDFEINGATRGDEIGAMVRALGLFKRASRQLEVWARERTERAEEEVRRQQEREREREEAEHRKSALLAEVAREFERTVGDVAEKVGTASAELGATATQMASTAQQTSEQTSALSQRMEDANRGATAAAAASDEFALSIQEISQQAAASSELARLAAGATEEADTTISALSVSAEEVGNVVELISTIAQRTNLLALNASIEAARGGEAGRGFAVVASEVKELAQQTSRATQQIAEQIRAMQDTTGASVSALRAIAGQVKELESTAISIASAVDQQSVAGQDLARSIDLAARGTEQVSGHIAEVRELSLSTGQAADQVLGSASALEAQATTLRDQVRTFLTRVREA